MDRSTISDAKDAASHERTPTPAVPKSEQTLHADRRTRSAWRWWWQVTAVFQVLSVLAVPMLMSHWAMWPTANPAVLVWWPGVIIIAANILWTFFIVPVIDAGDPVKPWNQPPRRQMLTLRQMVWAPFALSILGALLGLVIAPLMFYLERGRWDGAGLADLLLIFSVALTLTLAWGIVGSRLVRERFSRNAAGQRICFECGYPLGPTVEAIEVDFEARADMAAPAQTAGAASDDTGAAGGGPDAADSGVSPLALEVLPPDAAGRRAVVVRCPECGETARLTLASRGHG